MDTIIKLLFFASTFCVAISLAFLLLLAFSPKFRKDFLEDVRKG